MLLEWSFCTNHGSRLGEFLMPPRNLCVAASARVPDLRHRGTRAEARDYMIYRNRQFESSGKSPSGEKSSCGGGSIPTFVWMKATSDPIMVTMSVLVGSPGWLSMN